MTTVDQPIPWNRTVYQGTDHDWALRRTQDDDPIVPTSARAQIRSQVGGDVWLDLSSDAVSGARISIDGVGGWLHVLIPAATTEVAAWNTRDVGVWDLEVVVAGSKYRWVEGKVSVSHDVTREVAP